MTEDEVYRERRRQIVDFAFDDTVVQVFPDMIRRSVPGYELVLPMTGLLAARQLEAGARPLVYDLGCSLGATTLALLHAADSIYQQAADLKIQAIDNSSAMLKRARENITDSRVSFIEADINDLALQPCGAVLLNSVLQFLPPDQRLSLLARIHPQLDPHGILILSEKIRFDDPVEQAFNDSAHLEFKRANGYSELEISQKRSALEQVMIIDTLDEHLLRLAEAGYTRARAWFSCLNWISIVAFP